MELFDNLAMGFGVAFTFQNPLATATLLAPPRISVNGITYRPEQVDGMPGASRMAETRAGHDGERHRSHGTGRERMQRIRHRQTDSQDGEAQQKQRESQPPIPHVEHQHQRLPPGQPPAPA